MNPKLLFPFTAVVGQADVKEALLIALTNPKAGGVLIAGETGTAKSSLVRALAQVAPERKLVELPLNATEDMVFGTVDLEQAVTSGKKVFSPGILLRAHEQLLYVDEINLLRRELLTGIFEVANRGLNIVEREGISHRHAAQFTLIGTMNPEEGSLTASVLDRFGLFAAVGREDDPGARAEIVRRVLAYERDPGQFANRYAEDTNRLAGCLQAAAGVLAAIEVSQAMLELAAQYAAKAHSAGHRAEFFLIEAAKAIAALAGRGYLLPADLDRAAFFVLPHRMRQEETASQPPEPNQQEQPPDDQENQENQNEHADQPDPPPQSQEQDEPNRSDHDSEAAAEQAPQQPDGQDRTDAIDKSFSQAKLSVSLPQDRHARQGSGKRSLTRTDLKQGRYVRAALPGAVLTDLAFDATLRAAAPYQFSRPKDGCAIAIRKEDLRQKVREKRIGNIFLFVVDASGSMGAKERMRAVKGAIFAILQDAYQKRDQVGMIAFRRQTAEVLLPVTRSVDLAQKCLATLPTGGKTPLAAGLETALSVLQTLKKKDKNMRPVLIVVTDGRANSSPAGGDPVKEAVAVAEKVGHTGFASVVIDTETDFISLAVAKKLALSMGSTYYHIKDLSHDSIIHIVKNLAQ
jgi:magnesium chelatase subunit D